MQPNFIRTGLNIDWEEYSLTEPMTVPLSSSAIRFASYNPLTFTLTIDFTDGSVYEYSGVEPSTFIGLIQSSSVGRYFNYHIRDNYAYTEV